LDQSGPDVGRDQLGGWVREEIVEVGVIETVYDIALHDVAQIAKVDDDAVVVEFADDGYFKPVAVPVQVLARARVPLQLMSSFERKGPRYARTHAGRLLRFAVGLARGLVALDVVVLDPVPHVLDVDVRDYLPALCTRLELHGLVADRADGTVPRLDAAFDGSAFRHA